MDQDSAQRLVILSLFVLTAGAFTYWIATSSASFRWKCGHYLISSVIVFVLFGIDKGAAYLVLCPSLLYAFHLKSRSTQSSGAVGTTPKQAQIASLAEQGESSQLTQLAKEIGGPENPIPSRVGASITGKTSGVVTRCSEWTLDAGGGELIKEVELSDGSDSTIVRMHYFVSTNNEVANAVRGAVGDQGPVARMVASTQHFAVLVHPSIIEEEGFLGFRISAVDDETILSGSAQCSFAANNSTVIMWNNHQSVRDLAFLLNEGRNIHFSFHGPEGCLLSFVATRNTGFSDKVGVLKRA